LLLAVKPAAAEIAPERTCHLLAAAAAVAATAAAGMGVAAPVMPRRDGEAAAMAVVLMAVARALRMEFDDAAVHGRHPVGQQVRWITPERRVLDC